MEHHMTVWNNDVEAFRRSFESISREVRADALAMAFGKFKILNRLGAPSMIDFDLESDRYTIHDRLERVMADNAEAIACDSQTRSVHRATDRSYPVRTWKPFADVSICMLTCKSEASLRDKIMQQEKDVMATLLADLTRLFWVGNAYYDIHGVLNHPEMLQSKSAASAKWATADDNAIALSLIEAMDGMEQPRVLVASNIYRNGLAIKGKGNDTCSMKMDCVERVINAQSDIDGFDGVFESVKELNANQNHGDLVIVYDAAAVDFTMSDVVYMGATTEGQTNVVARRTLNTYGLRIEYSGAFHMIEGAGAGIVGA